MSTIAITGSASGIGAATRQELESRGDRVIGVDLRDAEVEADLSSPEGRKAAIEGVCAACDDRLDGLVTCAGIPGDVNPGPPVVSINYFGSAGLLEGLRPALVRGQDPSAIAIASLSATIVPNLPEELVDACLAGDESRARALAEEQAWAAYGSSKLAIARWVRRHAVTEEWAGAGVRLNAISPGRILTPLDDAIREDARMRKLMDGLPIPTGAPGTTEDVAGLVAFLLGPRARFFCGSVLSMDGGTDALVRGDAWPAVFRI